MNPVSVHRTPDVFSGSWPRCPERNHAFPPNQAITFNNKVSNGDKRATSFSKQFTTLVPHTSDTAARRVRTSTFTRPPIRQYPIYLHDRANCEGHQAKQQVTSCWPRWTHDAPPEPSGTPGPRIPYHIFNLSLQSADIHSI